MKIGRHFVVVKKLDTKTVDGNIVSNDFDIKEIEKTLDNATVDFDQTHIQYDNGSIYLILVCKEKTKPMSPSDLSKFGGSFH